MTHILIRWLVNAVGLWLVASIIDGIDVSGAFAALVAGALLGIVNTFIRPLFLLLTLPINILTLGLFTLVVNALMLLLVSGVTKGFEVHGFWAALIGSLLLSLISWAAGALIGRRRG
ncbi:MAG TPA: phage holin family protein [Limnochordia bacterium]|nr:phage holin family protein [Limnochordia bacterium]